MKHFNDIPASLLKSYERVEYLSFPDFFILNELGISDLKKQTIKYRKRAKKVGKKFSHIEALEHKAKKLGFESWKHLQNTYAFELDDQNIGGFVDQPDSKTLYGLHTQKQLMGAICRSINLNPRSISPIIQMAIPPAYIHAELPMDILSYGKYGLMLDSRLQNFLIKNKNFQLHNEEFTSISYLRLFSTDIKTHEEVEDFIFDLAIEIEPSFQVGGSFNIWINGKSSNDDLATAQSTCSNKDIDFNSAYDYLNLPEQVCKEIYI